MECLPTDIPTGISVDVSGMTSVHDLITVADLQLSSGITVHTDSTQVVVRVLVERLEEEGAEDEEGPTEVEVITATEAQRRAREREEED